MEKLLIIGINTRSVLNSALKLDYEIYSTSYFSTSDTPQIKNQKIILNESENESCGNFEEQFTTENILNISEDYIDEVDYIIPISGISPSDFKKKDQKKILGTVDIEKIEDKFKFYNIIKDEFLTPTTFLISDIDDAIEINKNYQNQQFIVKPIQGSGGYDINLLNSDSNIQFNDKIVIMQEYISGINLSTSLLASTNNIKCLTNSRLLTENDFNKNNNFKYIGNILPLTNKSIMKSVKDINEINEKLYETSTKLAKKFNLYGSNGIDYILNENGLYVIELNARIQGTFECVEQSFNINMLEEHIKASKNEEINLPQAQKYSYKKIIYSPTRMKYDKINLDNIYDLPHIGSITEKSQPLLTIIDKSSDFEKLYKKVELSSEIINNYAIRYQQDEE